ncbi:hypothetical protein SAY87_009746 [Trapa incisa]|uniref:Uncharacterized protein n=1 Tax=Trapa incisa TaxID=236973 RepID=A0AAN7PYI0_9MYRT|nr:hypothetical protein SAY87_009746 [Trapa incisa]
MAAFLSHGLLGKPSFHLTQRISLSAHRENQGRPESRSKVLVKKRCLRCETLYSDHENSPTACPFHGHTNGEKGLLALAPPHQGIDGEWTDGSGVIVYRWNDKANRPNTGRANWKKRWSCCAEYGDDAPPCRKGRHVSYDDGFTLF